MKELVCLDVFYDKSYCTNATQYCNNWEPGSNHAVQELYRALEFSVFSHSSCLQICYSGENKVKRCEPDGTTDGHKIPKKWHGCSNKANDNDVNWGISKTDEAISQGNLVNWLVGQHCFLKVGISWSAVYLNKDQIIRRKNSFYEWHYWAKFQSMMELVQQNSGSRQCCKNFTRMGSQNPWYCLW